MTSSQPTPVGPIGTLRRQDGAGVVRIEDHFATVAEDLWEALTQPSRLARWVAEVHGDLRVGGRFEATFTSGWEGPGRIDGCDPPHRLLLTMSPDSPAQTTIEATILPGADDVQLVIEERGLPLGEYAAYGAGWQAHVEDLAAHLSGRTPAEWSARVRELSPLYHSRSL